MHQDRSLVGMIVCGLAAVFLGLAAWFLLFRGDGSPALAAEGASNASPTQTAAPSVIATTPKPTTTGAKVIAQDPPAAKEKAAVKDKAASQSKAATTPPAATPARVRTPEEIRRAIVPPRSEVEKVMRDEPSGAKPELHSTAPLGQGLVEGRGSLGR